MVASLCSVMASLLVCLTYLLDSKQLEGWGLMITVMLPGPSTKPGTQEVLYMDLWNKIRNLSALISVSLSSFPKIPPEFFPSPWP